MDLLPIIESLGLRRPEARVYLAAVELGEGTAADIAKKARLKRPSVYVLLKALMGRGLIASVSRRGAAHFTAENPRTVVVAATERANLLNAALPHLEALAKLPMAGKPSVRFYEGISGIHAVLEDTLAKPSTTILEWSDAKLAAETMKDYYFEHMKKRIARNIYIRSILENNEVARRLRDQKFNEKRDVRIVPEKYNFNDEITVYGDKVAVASYKDLVALIIENKLFAETMRNVFELTWERAEAIQRPGI